MGFVPGAGVPGDPAQVPRDRGRLALVRALTVDLARSPARHGVGVFETIRIAGGRPRLLQRHLARLAGGLAELRLRSLPPEEEIRATIAEAIAAQGGASQDGVLRLIAVEDRLLVTAESRQFHTRTVTVGIGASVRRLSGAPTTRFKSLSYLDNVLLGREAAAHGWFDAIALNERGHLADGGRCNVYLTRDGRVLTPPASDGALPGVVRGILLESGAVHEAPLTPTDFAAAEAVAVSNALHGVLSVTGRGEALVAHLRETYEHALDPEP